MLRRLILTFALALLFGLGQQGAAVHEISHYADLAPLSKQQDKNSSHGQVCDKCMAYAELAGAVGTSHYVLVLADTRHVLANHHSHSSDSLFHTGYSARAPPVLS